MRLCVADVPSVAGAPRVIVDSPPVAKRRGTALALFTSHRAALPAELAGFFISPEVLTHDSDR
jgi:hypothetical protein